MTGNAHTNIRQTILGMGSRDQIRCLAEIQMLWVDDAYQKLSYQGD